MATWCRSIILIIAVFTYAECKIRLANSFGSHMVLQRAPKRAILWGYSDVIGDTVNVVKNGVAVGSTTVVKSPNNGTYGVWKLKLPAEYNPGPFSITVTSSEGSVAIHDVMFGDVWVCSGQSNMYFTMKEVYNSVQEIEDSLNYPDVRMLFSKLVPSNTLSEDVIVNVPWVKPMKGFIENFSALCFMFGRDLQKKLGYPIGLIESNWGGTAIELWSSPDAMAKCPVSGKRSVNRRALTPSSLWNSMIHPYLQTTITGAIWYQGEANAGNPSLYACRFPAMISDWRQKFNAGSDGETDADFPFGFVQLAPWRQQDVVGFAPLRWAQTADVGYVPNSKMVNTFMAVAIDLPDFSSPSGSIHPRHKQDIAARLTLGAMAVAYGEHSAAYQGPFPTAYHLEAQQNVLSVTFNNGALHINSNLGFEVCCAVTATSDCSNHVTWVSAPLTSHHASTVELDVSKCPSGQHAAGIRYLWRDSPCSLKLCPLYSSTSHLPMPPFIKTGGFSGSSSGQIIG